MADIRFLNCGDSAVTVEFSKEMNEETNRKIRHLAGKLKKIRGVGESVPTFCSMTVYFDPFVISRKSLERTFCVELYIREKSSSVYPLTSLRGVYPADCIVKDTKTVVKRV